MSKKSLESAIRELSEGKESGKPTPKISTPGNIAQPSELGDPGKHGNDPKAKGGVEKPMKDPLLTDPDHKHDAIDKAENATGSAKKRRADKSSAKETFKKSKVKEEEEIDDDEIIDEADETSDDIDAEDIAEDDEIVFDEDDIDPEIAEMVAELDEDELRERYAELLTAVLDEEIDENTSEEEAEEAVAEVRRRITAEDLDLSEDVEAMFAGDEDLSEDFQKKATTIFEAAVLLQVNNKLDELEEEFKKELSEDIERFESELTDKIDEYLNYCVEEWMEKNELAVERGIRAEISEGFIAGLKTLFEENYIDVPEEKVDVLDEMASEIDELKVALNEQIEKNVEIQKQRDEAVKQEILQDELSELAQSQVEKVAALAENVTFEDADQYREAIGILKESYLPRETEVTDADDIGVDEDLSETLEEEIVPQMDPTIAAASRLLGRRGNR